QAHAEAGAHSGGPAMEVSLETEQGPEQDGPSQARDNSGQRKHLPACGGPPGKDSTTLQFELREVGGVPCSGIDLVWLEVAQGDEAEAFDREAANNRTIDHGAAEIEVGGFPDGRQIAHETASKAVTRSGRIVRLFQRKGRNTENA